jgi:hypothetical protein
VDVASQHAERDIDDADGDEESRPRLVSDASNIFAEPWKLVVTVAGSI